MAVGGAERRPGTCGIRAYGGVRTKSVGGRRSTLHCASMEGGGEGGGVGEGCRLQVLISGLSGSTKVETKQRY
jgi:hypothetical protein